MTSVSLPPDLIESFLSEAWETVSVLERLNDVDTQSRAIEIATHRLKSSAALFSYPQISNLSGLLERVFGSVEKLDALEKQSLDGFAQSAAACLSAALERISEGKTEGDLGLEFSNLGGADMLHRLVISNPSAFVRAPQIENDSPLQIGDLQTRILQTEIDNAENTNQNKDQIAPQSDAEIENSAAELLQDFYKNNLDVWEYFAPEVTEHLEAAAQSLEKLEMGFEAEPLNILFRAMHTIKGAAYSVGCNVLGKAAHGLEDVLAAVRDGGMQWNEHIAQAMFAGLDTLAIMLAVAEGRAGETSHKLQNSWRATRKAIHACLGTEAPNPGTTLSDSDFPDDNQTQNLKTTIEISNPFIEQTDKEQNANSQNKILGSKSAGVQKKTDTENAPRTLRVKLDQLENLTALSIETMVARGRLEQLVGRFDALDQTLETNRLNLTRALNDFSERHLNPTLRQASNEKENNASNAVLVEGKSLSEVFSELEFDRYDDLNILARKVSEMSSDFNEIRNTLAVNITDLRAEILGLEKLVRSLQSEVGQMRLVSIQRLFSRVRRQVRSMIGDKQIELECIGDAELDNSVLESLVEPVIHLISNAIAHGIETPEERIALGKPAQGQLRLRAELRGTAIELEVSEDGRGIDVEAVKRRAVEKNLRRQEEVDALNHEQALDLIFLPGLSTRDSASQTAGRGVGMDVVWNSVRALKGEIKIESHAGQGASFRLRVPQNLSVTDVLFVRVGETRLAWPRDHVQALKTLDAELLTQDENGAITFMHLGKSLPVRRLSDALRLPTWDMESNVTVIVSEIDEEPHAIVVDEVLSAEQALVRPLQTPLSKLRHLLGTIIATDGLVVPMLSPAALLKLERLPHQQPVVEHKKQNINMHVLLVDDSLSVRKAVAGTVTRLGYEVTTASDGEEAWEKLQAGDFGAIITDLEMPKLNGYELVQRLRGHTHLAHLPVAMLTTRASDKHRELALSLGVNEYLTKPIEERKLQKFLEHANEVVA